MTDPVSADTSQKTDLIGKGAQFMRESSYHAILTEMTVRALWETQNVIDCIPDDLWDKPYGGAPMWQHIYHMLHGLDQWFINPRDRDFVEPPIHTPLLQDLAIYPATHLNRRQINDYFHTIKAKLCSVRKAANGPA